MTLYASNNSAEDLNNSLNRLSINTNINNTTATNKSNSNPNSSTFSNNYSILKIKNVPNDITLREAFLIFSLCLNDVNFVDIIQEPTNNNPIIYSKFYSSKIASQVHQLLNDKNLFGIAFPKVQCELIHQNNNNNNNNTTNNNAAGSNINNNDNNNNITTTTNSTLSNNLFTNPFNAQKSSPSSPTLNNDSLFLNLQQDNSHISIINTSNGNMTGWSNDTSTPLATPSNNNSKIIRPDALLLNSINSMNLNLSNQLINDWAHKTPTNSNFFNINDLNSPVNTQFNQNVSHLDDSHNNNQIENLSSLSRSNTNDKLLNQQQQSQQQLQQPQTPNSSSSNNPMLPDLSLLARVPPPVNPADQNPPCNTLYVGNLPPDTTENELRTLFRLQPGFKRLSFRTKQTNGVSSHHGPMCFVEFDDVALATRALAELYGRTLPRQNANNNHKGGIRLSFSKNPLGVRGPGQQRRNNSVDPQQQASISTSSQQHIPTPASSQPSTSSQPAISPAQQTNFQRTNSIPLVNNNLNTNTNNANTNTNLNPITALNYSTNLGNIGLNSINQNNGFSTYLGNQYPF